MDINSAAYNTAHDYKGGCAALAPMLGMAPSTLQNKVNPNEPQGLMLAEAAKMVEVSQDRRIPDEFAALIGGVIVQAGYFQGVCDQSLFEAYTKLMGELGEFSTDFNKALQDGKITHKEIRQLELQMREFQSAGAELLNRAKQIAEPDKDSNNE
jgi:hypothetical protein